MILSPFSLFFFTIFIFFVQVKIVEAIFGCSLFKIKKHLKTCTKETTNFGLFVTFQKHSGDVREFVRGEGKLLAVQ